MAKRLHTNGPFVVRKTSDNKCNNKKQLTAADVARNILFHKLESLHGVSRCPPVATDIVQLSSLAAPCSEEFAICLRRIRNGKVFIATPEVLNHAARKTNLSSTIALLDAVVRPPSTPFGPNYNL